MANTLPKPSDCVPFVCHECHKELATVDGLVVGAYPNFIHLDLDSTCPFNLHGPKEPAMPAVTHPALTKEQASDLKSHVARVVETELALQKAIATRDRAQDHLNSFVHKLEFPPKQGA